jgi:hypothetical protein
MAKKRKKSVQESVDEMDARRDMSSPEAFLGRLAADERRQKEDQKYKEEESARRSYGDLSGATFGKMETSPINPPEAEFAMSGPSANSAADSAAARYRRGGMVRAKKASSSRGVGCATRGFSKCKVY